MSGLVGNTIRRFSCHLILYWLLALAPLAVAQDPWESFNRRTSTVNEHFDRLLARPVARAYSFFTPRLVQQGIRNFFSNLDDINVTVNDVLQLKFSDAASDSGRFLLNTTVGLAGFLDVASSVGLEKNEEDFGQTLAFWNVGAGPYLVLPLLGPSTVRDAFGLGLDTVFDPVQYHGEASVTTALWIVRELDNRASLLTFDELITGDAYLFVREAYLQRRDYLIYDGEVVAP